MEKDKKMKKQQNKYKKKIPPKCEHDEDKMIKVRKEIRRRRKMGKVKDEDVRDGSD